MGLKSPTKTKILSGVFYEEKSQTTYCKTYQIKFSWVNQMKPYPLLSVSGRKGAKVFKYYVIRDGAHLPVGQLDGLVLRTIQNADYGDICPRTTAAELSKNKAKPYLGRVVCQKMGKRVLCRNIFEKTGV